MSQQQANYAFCGGGTGGHIFPALAVVSALKKIQPESNIYYFGKQDGLEATIVPKQDVTFYGLDLAGLSRSLSVKNIQTLWKAGVAYRKARRILKQLNVSAILGTGGFVCGPVIAAAASLGIPSIIHESNAVPGLTNRLLGGMVSKVAISHLETVRYFDEDKVIHTGFPLREGLNQGNRKEAATCFGLQPDVKTIFIFPGSLAARKINKSVMELLPLLKKRSEPVQLLWMTGKADYVQVQKVCQELEIAASVHEFIDEVPKAYAMADLIVARAGAGTVAEISVTAKPALLVPYPYATGDHQTKNALVLQKAGVATVLKDEEVNAELMFKHIERMLDKLAKLNDYAQVWKNNYPRNAARDLAKLMIGIGK